MKIALIGAGGKMGVRLSRNLKGSRYDVAHVEVSTVGRNRLKSEVGADCVDLDEALNGSRAVILAVPDTAIGNVSRAIIDKLAPGTIMIALDAAAPFAGHFPERDDVTYFVTHPCHPPIFNDETELPSKRDYFGGIAAKQAIVSALMQGPEDDFEIGEEIAKTIFQPILRSHRVTVEQMALLEPGLSETVCATLLVVMKEAMDEVVRQGVDRQAARDFLLGHLNILGAVVMEEIDGVFSDACNKAISNGKTRLMRDDWIGVFSPEEIKESIRQIT
ncbi:phosphogluconate dehydrogenase C-terminal domain-containing protein [Roseibium salinum]|uniref:NAD(P)-binding domain-containing protein n=1 Tax=Roseibium salinum TaxID=1604349 RepID=A0ABT3QXB5_9HYPH|nr:phosphogluconate dehydrogenase C-terminal domain-containing protein [Roseibium sp. DSM 29163]MCX2721584.1 NAD(P)-binding domain-containing protein [Roseibium sp. DSM 29163]